MKYGENSFKIELLGVFKEGELEEKEIEYIEYYNSYKNGYNSTLGGDGNKLYNIDEEYVLDLYYMGYSIEEISNELGLVSTRTISYILENNSEHVYRQRAFLVEQYKNGELINIFESKKDTWKWLTKNYRSNIKACTAYYYIKKSSCTGGIAFGYNWKQYETSNIICNTCKNNIENKRYVCDIYNEDKLLVRKAKLSEVSKILEYYGVANSKTAYSVIKCSNGNKVYGYRFIVYTI